MNPIRDTKADAARSAGRPASSTENAVGRHAVKPLPPRIFELQDYGRLTQRIVEQTSP
jgi:hypothetical protein